MTASTWGDADDPADLDAVEPTEVLDPEVAEQARAVAPLVLAHIQQHWHIPLQMPDVEKLEALRRFDPELYLQWRSMLQAQHDHDMEMEKAPYEVPARIARRGQWFGFAAIVAVLGVAMAMALTGHPGWAFGLVVIDIVGLAAVFVGGSDKDPPQAPRH